MADIVLTTLNAKYIHPSFGLRYLLANLGELKSRAAMVESDIHRRPLDVAEALLAQNPRIIGMGVYIWNAAESVQVAALLKRLRPDITLVLGGPEISHETESQPVAAWADYIIRGEADLAFAVLCGRLLKGDRPEQKIMDAPPPDLGALAPPYEFYDGQDLAHRLTYVEASRGCPFSCDFCLSSLDRAVRSFPLPPLLEQFDRLLERGARRFKFVDRSFNVTAEAARTILEFFLERAVPGLALHFEVVPDRLDDGFLALAARFPAGVVQFEAGLQTLNPDVAARINRRQNVEKALENLRFLRERTGVHLHTDLIAGLPGESLDGFAAGFDRLAALKPQEIQVGILKRLRGAAISRHDAEWGMVYSPLPPYEILENKLFSFSDLQRLRRFARFWDLVSNSGNFAETAPLVWRRTGGPFDGFLRFAEWLFSTAGRRHEIALNTLAELLFNYLVREESVDPSEAAKALWNDWRRAGRFDPLPCFQPYLSAEELRDTRRHRPSPKRGSGGATAVPAEGRAGR